MVWQIVDSKSLMVVVTALACVNGASSFAHPPRQGELVHLHASKDPDPLVLELFKLAEANSASPTATLSALDAFEAKNKNMGVVCSTLVSSIRFHATERRIAKTLKENGATSDALSDAVRQYMARLSLAADAGLRDIGFEIDREAQRVLLNTSETLLSLGQYAAALELRKDARAWSQVAARLRSSVESREHGGSYNEDVLKHVRGIRTSEELLSQDIALTLKHFGAGSDEYRETLSEYLDRFYDSPNALKLAITDVSPLSNVSETELLRLHELALKCSQPEAGYCQNALDLCRVLTERELHSVGRDLLSHVVGFNISPRQRAEALYLLGRCNFELGDRNAATRYFTAVKATSSEFPVDVYLAQTQQTDDASAADAMAQEPMRPANGVFDNLMVESLIFLVLGCVFVSVGWRLAARH